MTNSLRRVERAGCWLAVFSLGPRSDASVRTTELQWPWRSPEQGAIARGGEWSGGDGGEVQRSCERLARDDRDTHLGGARNGRPRGAVGPFRAAGGNRRSGRRRDERAKDAGHVTARHPRKARGTLVAGGPSSMLRLHMMATYALRPLQSCRKTSRSPSRVHRTMLRDELGPCSASGSTCKRLSSTANPYRSPFTVLTHS